MERRRCALATFHQDIRWKSHQGRVQRSYERLWSTKVAALPLLQFRSRYINRVLIRS